MSDLLAVQWTNRDSERLGDAACVYYPPKIYYRCFFPQPPEQQVDIIEVKGANTGFLALNVWKMFSLPLLFSQLLLYVIVKLWSL
jgi:hypothetical protein